MSFAIWKEKPPFELTKADKEQIYLVGNVYVVTDDPARATQAEVDAVLNAPIPVPDPVITQSQLQDALAAAGLSTVSVDAAITAVKANAATA